ncbi:MAG: hypothetical protein JWR01_1860 [Subtercola sp.]|nr:hypothetical protein [Subtercola sp.]
MTTDPYFRFGVELVNSRRLLLDALNALESQRQSLTVVGAHAVYERVKGASTTFAMDSTRDADLAVFPELVTSRPHLGEVMESLGLTLVSPSRPGVWGRIDDLPGEPYSLQTIDLIAPAALAGPGRRAATLPGDHGKNSVSKTAGVELSLLDRSVMRWEAFDSTGGAAEAFVAGTAALVCAKAYKLHDRLDARELNRNRERLRPKDAGDLWRLMQASDGTTIRAVFDAGIADSRIGDAVALGAEYVMALAANPAQLQQLSILHLRDSHAEATVRTVIAEWIDGFR